MGGAFSEPIPALQAAQPDTNVILNFILREMFRRADLVDMYSLADPEQCSKYIVIASDALEKLFAKQNLYPHKKGGLLYFQRGQAVRQGQQESCKELAFFFIRIFQTYAALALSILDSDLPSLDPVEILPAAVEKQRVQPLGPGEIPGFQSASKEKSKPWSFFGGGGVQVGGELTVKSGSFYITNEPYNLLNKYLNAPQEGISSTKALKFSGAPIYVPQSSLYEVNPSSGTRTTRAEPKPVILFEFEEFNERKEVTATLVLREVDSGIRVELQTIQIVGNEKSISSLVKSNPLKARFYDDPDPKTSDGKNLPEVIKELLVKGIREILGERFSVIRLFKEQGWVDSIDSRRTPVKGTRISLIDASAYLRDSSIPILYTDSVKIDGRSRDVSIQTVLEITKKESFRENENTYIVHVNFEKMKTSPDGLQTSLETKKERRREFFARGAGSEPRSEKNQRIPEFLQEVFEELLSTAEKGENDAGIRLQGKASYTYKEGYPKPLNSDRIEEPFKILRIWESLIQSPPVKAHCVARASQLLNVAAIRDPTAKEGFTSVCNLKFAYFKEKSLPTPGKSVLDEHGLYALAKLFVDGIVGASPRITSTEKFQEFGKKMSEFFKKYDSVGGPAAAPKSLEDIKESLPAACEGKERILVQGAMVQQLRERARALLDRQAIHVRNVMKLLFNLFNEQKIRAGSFELNEMVIGGGTEIVNKIAEAARELLTDYYGDCENTYRDGVRLVQDKYRIAPASAPLGTAGTSKTKVIK